MGEHNFILSWLKTEVTRDQHFAPWVLLVRSMNKVNNLH